MKTLKIRLLEHTVKINHTELASYSIQYKTGLLWKDYTTCETGLTITPTFTNEKYCIDEIFKQSKYKKTELKLKLYPTIKLITIKSN